MISLVQIQLLEEKVESAVAKILQLTKKNEELVRRCAQLEDEKAGLQDNLLNFHHDQERIEQGIIKALDRLNVVENSVLRAAALQQEVEAHSFAANEVQDATTQTGGQAQDAASRAVHQAQNEEVQRDQATDTQQLLNDETKESAEPERVSVQLEQPVQQTSGEDFGLAPMFSEEVVKNEFEFTGDVRPVENQANELNFSQPRENDLFVQNSDGQNSAQLDIF